MNDLLKRWLDERIADIDSMNCDYNDHVDQFIHKNEWENVYDDCISIFVDSVDYLIQNNIVNVVVFLNIALVQRNKFLVDYDLDLSHDIPNFVFDSGNTPPSLYVYRPTPQAHREGGSEYYVRPIAVDKRLEKYDCVSVYKCERDVQDIPGDYPFYRDIQIKCYL